MPGPGPSDLIQWFKVKYRLFADILDGTDADDKPDQTLVNGYITFTPNLDKTAPVVKYPEAYDGDTPFGFELAPLRRKVKVVNGVLSHNETGYVMLEANSTWANPPVWSWHVEFDLSTPEGKISRAGFDIPAVPDSVVDLTVVSPVSVGTGQQISQGPRGFSIAEFDITGDQFTAYLDDPLHTSVGTVTIPSVADSIAARDAALAAQSAAETARDTAQSYASAASGSATAAATARTAAEAARDAAQGYVNSFGLDIGTVTTTASGGSAAATISGTAPSYHLNLTLPRGLQGDPGPAAPDASDTVKGILQFGGVLAGSTATSQTLATQSVTAAMIANDTITATQIAANAITASELADNAVDTNAIQNLAVTGGKIANDTITATQIAADAITASELADNAVDTNAIANLAVTGGKIADSAVTSAKIADNTIVDADINSAAAIALSKLATGYVQGSKNGTATTITIWVGTEAQYNTATSNGTAENANTLYFRA